MTTKRRHDKKMRTTERRLAKANAVELRQYCIKQSIKCSLTALSYINGSLKGSPAAYKLQFGQCICHETT